MAGVSGLRFRRVRDATGDSSDGDQTAAEGTPDAQPYPGLPRSRRLGRVRVFGGVVGNGTTGSPGGACYIATRALRAELAQSPAAQDQLRAERDQHQAAVGVLAQIQAKLASD